MSNVSRASSGSSSGRPRERAVRERVVGVPKRCWCGELMVERISKSDPNPYRRYFRCGYAAENKLMNDNHIFKWVDEALLEEIETLKLKHDKLQQEFDKITTVRMEFEKMVFERMEFEKMEFEKMVIEKIEMKLEEEIFDKTMEAKSALKKMMMKMIILVVIGCILIVSCIKLVG